MDILGQPAPQPAKPERSNRLILKLLYIASLSIVLLIPATLINRLVAERKNLQNEVTTGIFSKWGGSQKISGPLLIIPYREAVKYDDGSLHLIRRMAYILPDRLNVNGNVNTEMRYRSIYKVPVYTSELEVSGQFDRLPLEEMGIRPEQVIYDQVQFVMGISDFRGLTDQVSVIWNNSTLELNTDVQKNLEIEKGLASIIPLDPATILSAQNFSLKFKLKGSQELTMIAAGKYTGMNLHSAWQNPEFIGEFLPNERTVDASGFTASWDVMHLNRNIPQYWSDADYSDSEHKMDNGDAEFGFALLQPVTSYTLTNRIVKYAFLVITLTFCVCFFIELFQKKPMHFLNYTLIGVALCIFYLLVLSVSEYLHFVIAYGIAALSTILLVASYMGALFKTVKTGIIFGGFMSLMYGFIFLLIQMNEFALLAGSIGIFVILAIIMYISVKLRIHQPHTIPAT